MTIYFLILERIDEVASTGLGKNSKHASLALSPEHIALNHLPLRAI